MFNYRSNLLINFTPLILALFITFFILFFGGILPPKLPIFYSLPWGENQLGNQRQILILPGLISLITLLNLILSWQLHPSQTFLKRLLLCSSYLITLILIITFLKIIFLFI